MAEAEPSVARLVPTSCRGSRCRHGQEVLTCDASLGSGGEAPRIPVPSAILGGWPYSFL